MKYSSRRGAPFAEGDMTPMIDMTFQLVAFFMVLVNFAEADQNELIKLPGSELAKPPDAPLETPITLQVTSAGTVFLAGEEIRIDDTLRTAMNREKQMLVDLKKSSKDATVIIRADRSARTGDVQKVIKICQDVGFEKFALRAKQEEPRAG